MEIEGYSIEKELSRGPITTVFLATQLALERLVLLKVLNVQWQHEKDLVERFHREAKIYARLKHPNIVNVFDFGTVGNSFYLAMEYVEGENLHELIKKYQPLPFDIILYITREILKGLSYAHSHGVIHRDIKPANIMIGGDGTVKIADFGLATLTDLPSITEQGDVVGTPAYMSPEQIQGLEYDYRSDLFSLGVTIYEMACGDSPFLGDNLAESLQKVLKNQPDSLEKVRPDVPKWFSDLVNRLLDKNPRKRPASAEKTLKLTKMQESMFDGDLLSKFLANPQQSQVDVLREKQKTHWRRRWLQKWVFLLIPMGILIIFLFILLKQGINLKRPVQASSDLSLMSDSPDVVGTRIETLSVASAKKFTRESIPKKERPNFPGESSIETKKIIEKGTPGQPSSPMEETGEIASGGIYIESYPWASVFINGVQKDTFPLSQPIWLFPGEYVIELKNPSYKTYRHRVHVESGKIDTLEIHLEPAIGYLSLKVVPWAEIFIDGEYYETTPLTKPLAIREGKHVIKLVNPNFEAWVDTISIVAGKVQAKQISLYQR